MQNWPVQVQFACEVGRPQSFNCVCIQIMKTLVDLTLRTVKPPQILAGKNLLRMLAVVQALRAPIQVLIFLL
jgi:hypothetical protein